MENITENIQNGSGDDYDEDGQGGGGRFSLLSFLISVLNIIQYDCSNDNNYDGDKVGIVFY